jgi:hypothetical protein
LYVNGAPVAERKDDPIILESNAAVVGIGAHLGAPGTCDHPLSGLIDEVMIWERALSAAEIKQLLTHRNDASIPACHLHNPSDTFFTFFRAPVAQLDRASDYGSEGCRFNSCQARHFGRLKKVNGRSSVRLRGGAAW